MLFHYNNGYMNAPQYYVIRTVPVLLGSHSRVVAVSILFGYDSSSLDNRLPTFRRTTSPSPCMALVLFSTYALQPSRLIVRSELEVPTFATRRLHACHRARAPSGGGWNCGREMSGKFCLNADFHVTFKDLLHAVKPRHGTDGFTSPPKEGVLRIITP